MLHIAKTDLKYDSDHVASFDAKISCFYKDIKEKLNIFYVGDIKKKKIKISSHYGRPSWKKSA